MELINTISVGSGGASSITFSSIPATFTDLVLVISGRTASSAVNDQMVVRFNGDSAGNYLWRALIGTGAAISNSNNEYVTSIGSGHFSAATNTTSAFGSASFFIPNYALAKKKTFTSEAVYARDAATGTGLLSLGGGNWEGTAAITSISISASSASNLVEFSSASLYGILKGSGGATVS